MDFARIQEKDFSVTQEIEKIKASSKSIGGIVSFLGTARDISKGEEISGLEFECYAEMAEKKLLQIRERAVKNFNIIEMAIIHRIGKIDIGKNIVLIIAAARHRNDAFMACEWAISELKRITPIWKKETTKKGEVWVEEHP